MIMVFCVKKGQNVQERRECELRRLFKTCFGVQGEVLRTVLHSRIAINQWSHATTDDWVVIFVVEQGCGVIARSNITWYCPQKRRKQGSWPGCNDNALNYQLLMDSWDLITHILQGCSKGPGALVIALLFGSTHYSDTIMSAMASQITSLTIVYPTVCSGADHRKHQSPVSLAFSAGNSPVTAQ